MLQCKPMQNEKDAKDFDGWNTRKKNINQKAKPKNTKRGEVWWCEIGVNIDREQDGGKTFERPILVLHRINYFLVLIAPLTSQVKNPESHFYHKLKTAKVKSTVLISQIRVISTKRLRRQIEKINNDEFKEIIEKISRFYNFK